MGPLLNGLKDRLTEALGERNGCACTKRRSQRGWRARRST